MKKFSSILLGVLQKTENPEGITAWSASQVYKPGDIVNASNNQVLKCREAPFGDFCNLNPSSRGGSIAWST